jgi:hypothetical protein
MRVMSCSSPRHAVPVSPAARASWFVNPNLLVSSDGKSIAGLCSDEKSEKAFQLERWVSREGSNRFIQLKTYENLDLETCMHFIRSSHMASELVSSNAFAIHRDGMRDNPKKCNACNTQLCEGRVLITFIPQEPVISC